MSLLWLVQKDLCAAAIILIPEVVPTTFVSPTIPFMMSLLMVGKTQQQSMAPNIKPQHFQTSRTSDQHDAPCAACYVRTRGSQIMIPGTNKCPSGWKREYKGHLMTSHNHAHSSDYVCTDEGAEVVDGGHSGTNGALLYLVQRTGHALPVDLT